MRLTTDMWLPLGRERVFDFFSDARNLQQITPPWVHIKVLNRGPIVMRPGAVIEYRIRLHGIPVRWSTEITRWDPPESFVDEQRRGPYRKWVHTHRFVAERGGTTIYDDVEFAVPFAAIAGPFVKRDLRKVFAYRHRALLKVFDQPHPSPAPLISFGA